MVRVGKLPLISVVDDDESMRDSLRSLLRSVGLDVRAFASAEEFLSSDYLHHTDCLVLDVRMPGMDGLELQRQLLATGSEIPVIFITAHGDEPLRARALGAGAVAFLVKPFSEDALMHAIRAALERN